jgi:replicative DNA helicase
MLLDKKFVVLSMTRLRKEFFLGRVSKLLYTIIMEYYAKHQAIITDERLDEQINNHKSSLKTADDRLSLIQLFNEANAQKASLSDGEDGESNFKGLMDEFVNEYKRDKILDIATIAVNSDVRSLNEEGVNDVTKKLMANILDIESTKYDVRREGSLIDNAQERLDRYLAIEENPESVNLIKSGFKHIDEAIVGWSEGSENIVCGRKGDGKSVMLLNLGHNLWKQGKNVIFFSLEIDKEQYERRWDARAALVSSKGLKAGMLEENDKNCYRKYIEAMKEGRDMFGNKVGDVYIVDCPSKVTANYISAKVEEVERATGKNYEIVIVDYMGIMQAVNPTGTPHIDFGNIALELKQFARDKRKVLFTAVQMNRSGKKDMDGKNAKADTDSIAGSDSIADHADTIFVVRSLDEETALVESSKTRDGSHFSFHIQKNYDKMQMIEIDNSEWDNA